MNPYEILEDLRKEIIKNNLSVGPLDLSKETITKADHLKQVNHIIDTLRNALDVAEYEFEFVDNKAEIVEMDTHQISITTLQENNTIIFQPLELLSSDIVDIDLDALQEAMQMLAENTGANVIMLPPSINVMVAKLKKPELKTGWIKDDDQHVQQD